MVLGKLKNSRILLIAAFIGCTVAVGSVFAQPLPAEGENPRPSARNSVQQLIGKEALVSGVVDLQNSISDDMAGQSIEISGPLKSDFFIDQMAFKSSGNIEIGSSKNTITFGSFTDPNISSAYLKAIAGALSPADLKALVRTQCPELFTEPVYETKSLPLDTFQDLAKKTIGSPLPTKEEMNDYLRRTCPQMFIPWPVNGLFDGGGYRPLFKGLAEKQEKIRRRIERYESEHAVTESDKRYCAALLSSGLMDGEESVDIYSAESAEISGAGYDLDGEDHPLPPPESEEAVFNNGAGTGEEGAWVVEAPDIDPEMIREKDLNYGVTKDYILFVRGILREWNGAKKTFYDQMEEISQEEAGAVVEKDGDVIEAVILLESLNSKDNAKDKDGESEEKKA